MYSFGRGLAVVSLATFNCRCLRVCIRFWFGFIFRLSFLQAGGLLLRSDDDVGAEAVRMGFCVLGGLCMLLAVDS
uniref:Uncharacterized protein n=1 Tax=Manihot esculenta TaxID=3983 RepID=A0A2C9W4P7_MANES